MPKIAVIEPIIALFVEIDLVALIIAGLFLAVLFYVLGRFNKDEEITLLNLETHGVGVRGVGMSGAQADSERDTKKRGVMGGGWVGVSGQLTTSDSYKSWYAVYAKSSFSMRAQVTSVSFF